MALFLSVACSSEEPIDSAAAAALTPFDAHDLDSPADDDDPYPERSAMISGSDEDYDWAVLRGWIKVGAADAWPVLTDPDVGVNRRDVASWTVARVDDSDVDSAYVVTEVVEEPITVDFDLTWRHDQAEDPADGSVSVWSKTGGTEFITDISGSIVATGHDDVVDFLVVFHLATIDSGPEEAEEFVTDFYASVLAAAHGEPLPTYE